MRVELMLSVLNIATGGASTMSATIANVQAMP